MFRHVLANVYAVIGPGSCRISSRADEGTQDVDYIFANVSSVAECKSLCDDTAACVAIGVRKTGEQCNLWTTVPTVTSTSDISSKRSCHRKQPPRLGWAVLPYVSINYV